ncbi:hemogen isoform X2 [Hyperolius riggenbachi]|uniref:hemogen isoform X2 n=1 Tax=Hyperolius riggenbachi TaxID=752182 RepID=UPI0035A2F73F
MDGSVKDHHYSEVPPENPTPASEHHEVKEETPVSSPRRLRDRNLLKRKKEESQEKDTYHEQTRSKRQRQPRGTGRGRRKKIVEPEPELEPEAEHEQPEVHEQAAEPEPDTEHEAEPEHKAEIEDDVQLAHQHEQEPLQHHDDPLIIVTDDGSKDLTLVEHEEANGLLPQYTTSFMTEKEEVEEVHPEPVSEEPEILSFSMHQEQEEHHYYTPLL